MDPYLLDLKRVIRDFLINNNTIKANIFIIKFFPKIEIADFNNIIIEAITKQRVFNISLIIAIKKINKLIRSLLNRKALGLNSIRNKVLKIVALIIIKNLAKTASYYFTSGIIPKHLKKSITMVLYKEGKKILFFKQL